MSVGELLTDANLQDWRNRLEIVGVVLLVLIVALFISIAFPQLVGADHSFVVQSDSMSPTISAGSVIYVNEVPSDQITIGEIITYQQSATAGSNHVTHRVVEVVKQGDEQAFRTKGDANEEPDTELVSSDQIVGHLSFHVPYAGYIVSFAGTNLGIAVLVIVPAIVLAITELRDLFWQPKQSPDDTGGKEG